MVTEGKVIILIQGGLIVPYVNSNYQLQHLSIFEWMILFGKTEEIRNEEIVIYFNVLHRYSTGGTEDILV